MKKISLQWRLTCIITLYIAVICGCLTLLVYKNGIYYIDSLQETVDARGDDAGDQGGNGAADGSDQIYISIPEDKWDEAIVKNPELINVFLRSVTRDLETFSHRHTGSGKRRSLCKGRW